MRQRLEPANAISNSIFADELGHDRAVHESALPAVKQLQSSSKPTDWAPQSLARAALVAKSRLGPIPDQNMRSRISGVPAAQYCGCPQALAGPVQTLHRSYYPPNFFLRSSRLGGFFSSARFEDFS